MDTQSAPVCLEGNYWLLLPLVSAFICWSTHKSPATWIILLKWPQIFLTTSEPRTKANGRTSLKLRGRPSYICFLWLLMEMRVHRNLRIHRLNNDRSNYALWITTLWLPAYATLCLVTFSLKFISASLKKEQIISWAQSGHAARKNAIKSCHTKCPCSLIYKQKNHQTLPFMWLLGDNYDKMKVVKFLPLFPALQMIPPIVKNGDEILCGCHCLCLSPLPPSSSLPPAPSVSLAVAFHQILWNCDI